MLAEKKGLTKIKRPYYLILAFGPHFNKVKFKPIVSTKVSELFSVIGFPHKLLHSLNKSVNYLLQLANASTFLPALFSEPSGISATEIALLALEGNVTSKPTSVVPGFGAS